MSTSIVKRLSRRLGGHWTYNYPCYWRCEDRRTVTRCSAGTDEFDNPLGPPQFWLKNLDGTYERAEKYICTKKYWPGLYDFKI